jgi:C1A family cysteine protease
MSRLAAVFGVLQGASAAQEACCPGPCCVEEFDNFVEKFGKDYGPEYAKRQAIFADNWAAVERANAKDNHFKLALNEYADLTSEEMAEMYGGLAGKPNMTQLKLGAGRHVYSGAPLANSIDWVGKGAVTPVKNQAECGSCWAFSSTGALEGAVQIATGKLVSFSEQQLVDCARFRYLNMGCSGGLQPHAFNYMKKNDLCTEAEYPYIGKNNIFTKCQAKSCSNPGLTKGTMMNYKFVDGNEQALMEALQQQPVSVSIEADEQLFHFYSSGVLHGEGCGTALDHAVLAVGYGGEGDLRYWKVKNSWGTTWGEAGYVRIVRGVDECGILKGPPVYPVVKAPEAEIQV